MRGRIERVRVVPLELPVQIGRRGEPAAERFGPALAGVDRVDMHRMITRTGRREQLSRDRR
jgi:hypothetical protein